jgi:hypothetical protein
MGYLESFHSFGNNTAAGYKWVSGAPFLVAAAKRRIRKTVPRLRLTSAHSWSLIGCCLRSRFEQRGARVKALRNFLNGIGQRYYWGDKQHQGTEDELMASSPWLATAGSVSIALT